MKQKIVTVRLLIAVALVSALAPIATVRATPLNLYVNAGILGGENGNGTILEYTPAGAQSTFAAGLNSPRGSVFDSAGNYFVASTIVGSSDQGTVLKFTPEGSKSNFGSIPGNVFPEAVVRDSAGNIYVMAVDKSSPTQASTIFKFTPGGTRSIFGSTPGQGFGLAFNSAGDLFATDGVDQTIFKFTPSGTRSVFASGLNPNAGVTGLAFNSAGDLFVSQETTPGAGTGSILEFTPGGTESTFASGLDLPRGLAFNSAGDLFVAEPALGDIEEFTPGGTETVFATGIAGPQWITFGPARASVSAPDSGSTMILLTISTLGLVCVRRMVKT
jgi:WD40 repeat protein